MSFDVTAALPRIQASLDSPIKYKSRVVDITTSDIPTMANLLETAAEHSKTEDDVEPPSSEEMLAPDASEDRSQSFTGRIEKLRATARF